MPFDHELNVVVPAIIEHSTSSETIAVGIQLTQFTDPTDPDYLIIRPELYLINREPRTPRHIVFLVDVSASMHGQGIAAVQQCLPLLFKNLNGNDLITLKTFSDQTYTLIDLKSKAELEADHAFVNCVEQLKPLESTALFDAIGSLSALSQAVPANHTTVILFSDGANNSSKTHQTITSALTCFNQAFNGCAPRFFPIGMGSGYDQDTLRQLAIESNGAMIDARDQAKLYEHVDHIRANLAQGLHVKLAFGTEHCAPLHIVNYNEHSLIDPIRIPKTSLAEHYCVFLENNIYKIEPDLFIAEETTPSTQREVVSAYVLSEAKKIYNRADIDFVQKMDQIKALREPYALSYLGDKDGSYQLLVLLDKKRLAERASSLGLTNTGHMLTYQYGWEENIRQA